MGWLLAQFLKAVADVDVSGSGVKSYDESTLKDTFEGRTVELFLTESKPNAQNQTYINVSRVRRAVVVPDHTVVTDHPAPDAEWDAFETAVAAGEVEEAKPKKGKAKKANPVEQADDLPWED